MEGEQVDQIAEHYVSQHFIYRCPFCFTANLELQDILYTDTDNQK